ncbi:MAG: YggS family pyridoxal phosphate-dependent enzyme [Burkholderiales bacterium]|nr:YggS family pyridoxal phosphate-dependent enzyme [Burkholderiales bacterium]
MEGVQQRLQAVRDRIETAAQAVGRDPAQITLIAVSKTFPVDAIRAAAAAGQRDFGESYVQEADAKIDATSDLSLIWHHIGPIQSNKTRSIAERCHWVHAVDRAKIAERLSMQRPAGLAPLQICLQVNVSGETTKSGVDPADVLALAAAVTDLPHLRLRGLMAIPAPTDDVAAQRRQFGVLRACLERLNAVGHGLDTLSMGMSDDLESAIAEGATMVRVGRAIFGTRDRPRAERVARE